MPSSRSKHLKSLILQIAANWLEVEKKELVQAKEDYMKENCPPAEMGGGMEALQAFYKKLGEKVDKIDEERYDLEQKVGKGDKELEDLRIKMVDLGGPKKPALKKVRMSASAMLTALLGTKHTVNMELRAGLKPVTKEKKEEAADAGDWRQNIEEKADRKKMFEG